MPEKRTDEDEIESKWEMNFIIYLNIFMRSGLFFPVCAANIHSAPSPSHLLLPSSHVLEIPFQIFTFAKKMSE